MNRSERRIVIASVIVSVLFSGLAIFLDSTINPDGYLYLKSAEHLLQGNVEDSLTLYGWPFYSGLIAAVAWVTGLDPEYAAYAINTACFALLTISFLSSIKISGGGREELLCGAILLLSHPGWNRAYRSYIMRDAGYWAFFMLGFLYFVRYWKGGRTRHAWFWGGAMFAASLFRIEGMVFLAAAPLVLLIRPETPFRGRLRLLVQAWFVPMLGASALLVVLLKRGGEASTILGRIPEFMDFFQDSVLGLKDMLQVKGNALREAFFTGIARDYSRDYAIPAAISVLGVVILMEIVGALTPVYLVPLGYGLYRRVWRRMTANPVVVWFGFVNLFVLTVFVFRRYFLTGRYPMPLVLILMLYCAFGLAHFWGHWREFRYRDARVRLAGQLAVLVWAVVFLSGFVSFSPSKRYINEAGLWIQERGTEEIVVYSNVPSLLYRTKAKEQRVFVEANLEDLRSVLSQEETGYVALRVRRRDEDWQAALSGLGMSPIQVFSNRAGDKVVIYSIGPRTGSPSE